MVLLKDLGVGRRENIRSKEVFQEDHSCCSAPDILFAQNISNCAEAASRAVVLWLMKGMFCMMAQYLLTQSGVLLYVSKELPRKRASFWRNHSIPEAL